MNIKSLIVLFTLLFICCSCIQEDEIVISRLDEAFYGRWIKSDQPSFRALIFMPLQKGTFEHLELGSFVHFSWAIQRDPDRLLISEHWAVGDSTWNNGLFSSSTVYNIINIGFNKIILDEKQLSIDNAGQELITFKRLELNRNDK